MSTERPLVITGPGGVHMFAILHEPDRPRPPRTGVHLLNPGLRNRMAPNRFNVRLARRLAAAGYWVLCLDPPGIGDSGGDLPENAAFEVQHDVQTGAFVDAVRMANEAFIATCKLDDLVVSGNCGGAITALLEAPTDPNVRRLVLLDIPVTLRDIAIDAPRPIYDRRHGTHVLRRYSRRMRDWRAWLRLTRFQSNYSYIGRALMAAVRGGSAAGTRGTGGQMGGNDTGSAGGESVGTMSPVFFKAVKAFHQRGGRALFINSERSKTTFLFDTRFAEVYLAPGKPMHGPHEVITVAGANHTYSTPEWFDAAANAVLGWIAKDPARAERAAVV